MIVKIARGDRSEKGSRPGGPIGSQWRVRSGARGGAARPGLRRVRRPDGADPRAPARSAPGSAESDSGRNWAGALTAPAAVERFLTDLGAAVARLHRISSTPSPRGSAAARLLDLVGLPGSSDSADRRAGSRGRLVPAGPAGRTVPAGHRGRTPGLPVVPPRLTHRDLHLDDVIATEDGRAAAIVDFDRAEARDPAADPVKPRRQICGEYPGSEAAFRAGHRAVAGAVPAAGGTGPGRRTGRADRRRGRRGPHRGGRVRPVGPEPPGPGGGPGPAVISPAGPCP